MQQAVQKELAVVTDYKGGHFPEAASWSTFCFPHTWGHDIHKRAAQNCVMERDKYPPINGFIPSAIESAKQHRIAAGPVGGGEVGLHAALNNIATAIQSRVAVVGGGMNQQQPVLEVVPVHQVPPAMNAIPPAVGQEGVEAAPETQLQRIKKRMADLQSDRIAAMNTFKDENHEEVQAVDELYKKYRRRRMELEQLADLDLFN